ncbi:uncharacterized protein [Channa argus]|uniref:uncharacterized protein isoform X2 n=1 Tax=Channa argus TaxID=215402 RepID=UPI003522FD47
MSKYSEKLSHFNLPDDLHDAAETLFKFYSDPNKTPEVQTFFDWICTELSPKTAERVHTVRFPTVRVPTVRVHTVTTGETFGADRALMEKVKNCAQLQVDDSSDSQGCDIIIVFCPVISRPGSDVEAAMMKVSDDKPVILVTMYHTRDVHYSTSGTAWSQTYQKVQLDVPVLFHETKQGLLTCPRNEETVSQIQDMLKKYSRQQQNNKCCIS